MAHRKNVDKVDTDLTTPHQLGVAPPPPFLSHGGRATQQQPVVDFYASPGGIAGQEYGQRSRLDKAHHYLAESTPKLVTGSQAMGGYSPHTQNQNRAPFQRARSTHQLRSNSRS